MAKPAVTHSEELEDEICQLIGEGHSIDDIAARPGMPHRATIFKWLERKEGFVKKYVAAKERQADRLVQEILEIADDGRNDKYVDKDGKEHVDHDHIQRSKLRVDSRKWLAAKLAPRKYGDRQMVELEDRRQDTAELLSRARTAAEKLGIPLPDHLAALENDPDED